MIYILLFMVAALDSIFAQQCYAAEQNLQPIALINGMLTPLQPMLVLFEELNTGSVSVKELVPAAKQSTVAKFMETQIARFDGVEGMDVHKRIFCPALILLRKNGKLKSKGLFTNLKQEAIEACRQNLAAFYPYKHGAIIYSRRPGHNFNFDEAEIDLIKEMITVSIKKKIHFPLLLMQNY